MFEALEDEGYDCGRDQLHVLPREDAPRAQAAACRRGAIAGTSRRGAPGGFFFFNLYESDATGARSGDPLPPRRLIDAYAATIGRWLVTRDGFDFLVFYLPDYDYASHIVGPEGALLRSSAPTRASAS